MSDNTKRTECQVYSRCCGWFVPILTASNPGKVQEFKDRKAYDVSEIVEK